MDTGMERINILWKQEDFQKLLLDLENKESDRIYCRHGREHIFAVARLMWIACLEEQKGEDIAKELVYAVAFLHDLGRCSGGKNHAAESARIAGRLLPLCGYSEEETGLAQFAIWMHGQAEKTDGSREEIHRSVCEASRHSGQEIHQEVCEVTKSLRPEIHRSVCEAAKNSGTEIYRKVSETVEDCGREKHPVSPEDGQYQMGLWLSELLLKADHDSRDCYACAAREGCYWSEKRKVSGIMG